MEIRLNFFKLIIRSVFVLISLSVTACAGLPQMSSQSPAPLGSQAVQIKTLGAQQDTVADASYALMVAEIALNQGDTALAIKHYLELAKSQNNPDIAERAVRVAVYGQDLKAAIEAAQRWIELDPKRVESRQVIAAIYIRQDNIAEAFNYINGLIQSSELEDEKLFPPLLGLLAREKNANTVLAVTQRLASENPSRAYAQYVHGMLAAQNGRPEEALKYLDRSIALADIEGVHSARRGPRPERISGSTEPLRPGSL